MAYIIRKSSGEKQRFDLEKFRRSLSKAGASPDVAEKIVQSVLEKKPSSTHKLHKVTTAFLKESMPVVADRYNLKRALAELGPEGFIFEQFIAKLLMLEGFNTQTDVIIPGKCVDHEIDIICHKENEHAIVECKFHNNAGIKTDVVVALYMQARFQDLKDAVAHKSTHESPIHTVIIVTNTKFTQEAIKYAMCKNMRLLAWDYPQNNSLAYLIDRHQLYPITTLTSLSSFQKKELLKNNLFLCKDLPAHRALLSRIKYTPAMIETIIQEAQTICQIR